MRAYVINEIPPPGMQKIHAYLKKAAIPSSLKNVFWLQIPEYLLNETQREHPDCQPHVIAVETGRERVSFECFVRSLNGMQCNCRGYCSEPQARHIIRFADEMIDRLSIKT